MVNFRKWLWLVETNGMGDETELTRLQQQLAALILRWQEINDTKPEGLDTGKGYSVETEATRAWHDDPARGRLWELEIYPLRKRVEQLEKSLVAQRRKSKLVGKAGSTNGFDTDEVLFHGTAADFTSFDRAKSRTASHIYTSPDIKTAKTYGPNVYAIYGRQRPQADLTIETSDYGLLRKIHRKGSLKAEYGLSLDDFSEMVFGGDLYQSSAGSGLQDYVIDTCFSMGFRSVRLTDRSPTGADKAFSDSVIFEKSDDLTIIERD